MMQAWQVSKANVQFSSEQMDAAFEAFQAAYPEYNSTSVLDELRATEYARLDRLGHVYLDYTGGGLYAESQLREHMALLDGNVFGNPHSKNLTSMAMTHWVEQARDSVLKYFNASPDEYIAIFTQNSTGALKLVGESYPFAPGDHYLLTFDNHNSVNGIREFARSKGATVTYIPVVPPDLPCGRGRTASLDWMRHAPARITCSPIRRSRISPACSIHWNGLHWHRLRGGMCCWMRRRSCLPTGSTSAGGILISSPFRFTKSLATQRVQAVCWCAKAPSASCDVPGMRAARSPFRLCWRLTITSRPVLPSFEDGTVNYLSLPAVEIGLKYIESIGMEVIHTRVMCLTGWLIDQLLGLRHSNGQPVIRLYGPPNTDRRGGTVQVNFFDPEGQIN